MRTISLCLGLLLALGQATAAQELGLELPDRQPAQIMSYRGADWLERPERVAEEMPEEVLATLALSDGDVVADLGAGSGFYTRRIARLVAPSGSVYAVDVQPEMLDILRRNVQAEGLSNVVPVLGEADDPRLPAGSVDWILLSDVYHEFEHPEAMLARMREALAEGGRVALLEYRVEDGTGDHILADHRMSVRQVMTEWEPAGFELVDLHEFLPGQHFFVFQAAGGSGTVIRHHDLLDATAEGLVEMTVRGAGERAVEISVRRLAAEPMVLTYPVGTFFEAPAGTSDMVALRDVMVLMTDETATWTPPARLAHPTEGEPGASDELQVESADDHRRERNVMWVFQGLDFPPQIAPILEQLTLWVASADIGYDEVVEEIDPGAPIPTPNAIALALAYLESAGMDPTATRLWRERDRYLPAISDPSLRGLFEEWGAA
ncbi:MAG: class I SAM-dependent methyltransferase [Gemmatimonadota bacterium]|jgi:SAM-dependent methyltransferase